MSRTLPSSTPPLAPRTTRTPETSDCPITTRGNFALGSVDRRKLGSGYPSASSFARMMYSPGRSLIVNAPCSSASVQPMLPALGPTGRAETQALGASEPSIPVTTPATLCSSAWPLATTDGAQHTTTMSKAANILVRGLSGAIVEDISVILVSINFSIHQSRSTCIGT